MNWAIKMKLKNINYLKIFMQKSLLQLLTLGKKKLLLILNQRLTIIVLKKEDFINTN